MKNLFFLPVISNLIQMRNDARSVFLSSVRSLQSAIYLLLNTDFGIEIKAVSPIIRVAPTPSQKNSAKDEYFNGFEFSLSTETKSFDGNHFNCYVFPDGRIYFKVYYHEGWSGAEITLLQSLNANERERYYDSDAQAENIKLDRLEHLISIKEFERCLPKVAAKMRLTPQQVETFNKKRFARVK